MNIVSKGFESLRALDGGSSEQLRGDKITGDRYYSKEFMQREWDTMWTRVWHIGCKLSEIPESGDFVQHNIMQESVLLVRQDDGSVRAFYNVCQHRGNRLVWVEEGSLPAFTCAYHGWKYSLAGNLIEAQDPEDFRGGNPCTKVKLRELRCQTWGGFAWYTMADDIPDLQEFLHPMPTLLANRNLDTLKRVVWRKVKVRTNWKFASDNFNESYHLPVVHPQMRQMIDEDYRATVFEMYEHGHNRMIELGRPSMRADHPNQVEPIWEMMLKAWDIDPEEYQGKSRDARIALQKAKREKGAARGHTYIDNLEDDELTDYFHHTIFPNITITATPVDGQVHVFRTEPDPVDPESCTFEYWCLAPSLGDGVMIPTVSGPRAHEEAEVENLVFGEDDVGDFVDQDLAVAVWQQKGLHSRGYQDAHLSEQEARIRRFHEVLNDYLEGRR